MPIAAFVRLRLCLGFEYSPLPASNRDPSQGLIFDNASDGWVQRGGVNLGRRLGGKQVDLTRRAAEMGDQNWRRLLDSHDQLARQMVERQRGSLIKNTGDGILATFDGPGRAVRCALAFSAAAKQIGLPLRSGLHTGEIEVRGRDRATQSAAHVSKSTRLVAPRTIFRRPAPEIPQWAYPKADMSPSRCPPVNSPALRQPQSLELPRPAGRQRQRGLRSLR